MVDCIPKLKELYGDKIAEEDLRSIDSQLRAARESSVSDADFQQKADAIYTNFVRENVRATRAKITNQRATARQNAHLSNPAFKDNPKLAWKTYTFGDAAGVVEGGNAGVKASATANAEALFAPLFYKLKDLGIMDSLKQGAHHLEIYKIMHEMKADADPKVLAELQKKNPMSFAAATAFKEFNQALIGLKKSYGVVVGEIDNYITQRIHSPEKIRATPKEQWVADVVKYSDLEAAKRNGYKNVKEFIEFIEEAYNDIIDNAPGFYEAEVPNKNYITVKDGTSINTQSNRVRKFFFKDGEAEFNYWKQYGDGNLLENAYEAAYRGALNAEMVARFGVDAKAGIKNFATRLNKQFKGTFISEAEAVDRFNAMSGFSKEPGGNLVQKSFDTVRTVEMLSKLGNAMMASVSDVAFGSSAIKNVQTGKSMTASVFGLVQGTIKQLPPSIHQESLRKMQQFTLDIAQNMLTSEMDGMTRAGLHTRMLNNFFTISGLNRWVKSVKTAVAVNFSEILHGMKDVSYGNLDPFMKDQFTRIGLTEAHWNVVRTAVDQLSDGRKILSPEALDKIDLDPNVRREAKSALIRAYNDLANIASITPNESTRNLLRLGTNPNTVLGAFVKMITMFKSFPVMMHHVVERAGLTDPTHRYQSFGQAFSGMGAKYLTSRGAANVAQMFVAASVLGAISQAATDVLKGKVPRGPDQKEFWETAFSRSGVLGLYGDFLLGEHSRTGSRGWLGVLGGPVAGDFQTVGEIYGKLRKGQSVDKDVHRLLKSNIPYGNLFYVKAAVDYGIHYNFMEWKNPGSLRRMEKNAEKGGSRFIVPPSEVIK